MYTRETELRHLRSNDVNRLAEILGFDGGRRLMEIIPKYSNNQPGISGDGSNWNGQLSPPDAIELKYKPEHIRLIEDAARQNSGCYFAEILIDEWGTSGRKHERPTVGLLLQLLMQEGLWRAVDFVAEEFLNEPPPDRPLEGPAARIDISLPSEIFQSVAEMANDSTNYPDTEALNDNANCVDSMAANNRDYYTKYHRVDKELNTAPKPPPRVQRGRLKQQQQQLVQVQQQTDNGVSTAEARDKSNSNMSHQQQQSAQQQQPVAEQQINTYDSNSMATENIPILSALMTPVSSSQSALPNTVSTYLNEANDTRNVIPILSILADNGSAVQGATTSGAAGVAGVAAAAMSASTHLPLLTELNLNSEENVRSQHSMALEVPMATTSPQPQSEDSRCSSLSNDSIEDEDAVGVGDGDGDGDNDGAEGNENDVELAAEDSEDKYLPNLSIFGRTSPNNDSSLTTVTGTSGENSFELSMNDSSSASNDNNMGLKK